VQKNINLSRLIFVIFAVFAILQLPSFGVEGVGTSEYWSNMKIDHSDGYDMGAALVINSSSIPLIALPTHDGLSLETRSDGGWHSLLIENTMCSGRPTIALDSNEVVHIAYAVLTNPGSEASAAIYELKCAMNISSIWTITVLSTSQNGGSISNPTLANDANGILHLYFVQDGVFRHLTWTAGAWTKESDLTFSMSLSTLQIGDTTIDNGGFIHVICWNISSVNRNLYYLSNENGIPEDVLLATNPGQIVGGASIAVSSAGNVAVCYSSGDGLRGISFLIRENGLWMGSSSPMSSSAAPVSGAVTYDGQGHLFLGYLIESVGSYKIAENQGDGWIELYASPSVSTAGLQPNFPIIQTDIHGNLHSIYQLNSVKNYLTDAIPSPPQNLSATTGDKKVILTWSVPSTGLAQESSYAVYRQNQLITIVHDNSFIDNNVTNGQNYNYCVTVVKGLLESGTSNFVIAMPRGPPGQPTHLTITSNKIGEIALSWQAPDSDGGIAIDCYVVYSDGVAMTDDQTGLSTDIPVGTDGGHSFTVAAHNTAGIGKQSNAVSYTVSNAPTWLTAIVGNDKMTLNWSIPAYNGGVAIDYYIISQNGVALAEHPTGLSTIINNLVNGQSYSFTVAAHNAAGIGPDSSALVVSPTQTKPTEPMNVTAWEIDSGIVLSWSAPIDKGGYSIAYNIFRSTSSEPGSLLATVSGTSYSDMEITLGTNYHYYVEAVNQLGSSAPSKQVGPISASAAVALNMETDSSSSSIGILITINGGLKTVASGQPVSGMNIDLSYSVDKGQSWIVMTSLTTSPTGNFSTQWIPTVTGVYMLKGSWDGNAVYQPSTSMMSLAVTASSGNYVFTVQSNSTVSGLSFNSTNSQLSFTISGQTGTSGYTRIVVSKQLVADGETIRLSMDGSSMNYSLSSSGSSWILYFTYHHSTHSVVASLNEAGRDQGSIGPNEDAFPLVAIGGACAIALLLVLGVLVVRKRRGKTGGP
jgi:fibronectin type 3 domain-containing protein